MLFRFIRNGILEFWKVSQTFNHVQSYEPRCIYNYHLIETTCYFTWPWVKPLLANFGKLIQYFSEFQFPRFELAQFLENVSINILGIFGNAKIHLISFNIIFLTYAPFWTTFPEIRFYWKTHPDQMLHIKYGSIQKFEWMSFPVKRPMWRPGKWKFGKNFWMSCPWFANKG